jgi:hypothetical protein
MNLVVPATTWVVTMETKGKPGHYNYSSNNLFGRYQANSWDDKKGMDPVQIATLDVQPCYWA